MARPIGAWPKGPASEAPVRSSAAHSFSRPPANRITRDPASLDLLSSPSFHCFISSHHNGVLGLHTEGDKEEQEQMTSLSTRPCRSVEHSMVMPELPLVVLSHHPYERCSHPLSWGQYRSNESHLDPFPSSFAQDSFTLAEHASNRLRQIHVFSSFLTNRLREDSSAFFCPV